MQNHEPGTKRERDDGAPESRSSISRTGGLGLHRPVPQHPSWALKQASPEREPTVRAVPTTCPPQPSTQDHAGLKGIMRRYGSYTGDAPTRVPYYESLVHEHQQPSSGAAVDRARPSLNSGCRTIGTLEEERLLSLISSRVLGPLEMRLEDMERRMVDLIQSNVSQRVFYWLPLEE
mmetsp:Transcript_13017/g.36616  ORF Transcript_13017/g.36616 Transcript_13017/m.36616 type:complete len:176 (-) Transcript_13017:181-708(-)